MYKRRNVGDVIANDAVLVKRVNGRLWKIRCACGNEFVAQPSSSSGRCTKCGYLYNSKMRLKHGESPDHNKSSSRLYSIWLNMRQRCNNPHLSCYQHYGGRGITVCAEWADYVTFKEWALTHGYDDALTLDRINVDGNYSPSNCRWITQREQCRNKRDNHLLTFHGQTKTLVEWSEETGIPYHTLKGRINRYHFSVEDALTLPVKLGNNQNLRSDK